jgi:type IV pilus assembly protein PilM
MGRSSIGLDIGTRAVRLAEVNLGGQPNVTRFGRMLLPTGAVEHGEVVDPRAVGKVTAELWKRLGMNGNRSVHIGMANRRVVVRIIELPAMSPEDLHGAIRFQAQDQMPIALDEAVMDYDVLEEVDGPNGRVQRVLVVAAEQGTIAPLLEAVKAANLEIASLEFNAYPLVRCFSSGPGPQAVVDVGAGVTNIVVHQGGKIRFTRTLPNLGGDDFTQAIVEQLRVSRDDAERMKRETSMSLHLTAPAVASVPRSRKPRAAKTVNPVAVDSAAPAWGPMISGGAQAPASTTVAVAIDATQSEPVVVSHGDEAARALEPLLDRLVSEIRGSIDFFNAQNQGTTLERIVLTGGGSLISGLTDRVQSSLGLHTEPGRPFERAPVVKIKVSKQEVSVAEPFMGVAVGLALAGSGA